MVYYLRTRAKKPNQCDRFIVCIPEQSAAQVNVVSTKWSEMPTMLSTGEHWSSGDIGSSRRGQCRARADRWWSGQLGWQKDWARVLVSSIRELSSHSVPRSQSSFLLSRIFRVPYYTRWSLIGTQDEFCSALTHVFWRMVFLNIRSGFYWANFLTV
jgi:hypothetical protein